MPIFNAIQMVMLLMASPILLSLAAKATFVGAGAVFWVGLVGTIILALLVMGMVASAISGG